VNGNQGLSCVGPGFIVPFFCIAFNKINVVVLPSSARATVKVNILMNNTGTPTTKTSRGGPTIVSFFYEWLKSDFCFIDNQCKLCMYTVMWLVVVVVEVVVCCLFVVTTPGLDWIAGSKFQNPHIRAQKLNS